MKLAIKIGEFFCVIGLVACAVAFCFRDRSRSTEPMAYFFRGEFCGVELWEYSARGDQLAFYQDWVTNAGFVHCVLRTNTVEGYLKERR